MTGSLVGRISVKGNRCVYFTLGLLPITPVLFRHFTLDGFAAALAVAATAFYILIIRIKRLSPAAGYIPAMLFTDICILAALQYRPILTAAMAQPSGNIFKGIEASRTILFAVGAVICFAMPKKPGVITLRALGFMTAILALIMHSCGFGSGLTLSFNSDGAYLVALFLMFTVIWFLAYAISAVTDESVYTRNNLLTAVLLAVVVWIFIAGRGVYGYLVGPLRQELLQLAAEGLDTWKLALAVVILLVCAAATSERRGPSIGADAMVLAFVGGVLILAGVLWRNYFDFNWLILLVFSAAGIMCIRNESRGTKTFRLANPVCLAVLLGLAAAAAGLLERGLWISTATMCVYAAILYFAVGTERHTDSNLSLWLLILSCPAVFAVAYAWQAHFSAEIISVILLAYIVQAFALLTLCWPHPGRRRAPVTAKAAICAFLAVICTLALTRFGAEVCIEFNSGRGIAVVDIEAKGKENEISDAEYYWSSMSVLGFETSEPLPFKDPGGGVLPIDGNRLTVIVTDAYGVVTTQTAWYPAWVR